MTTDAGRAITEFLAGFARPFAHLADHPEDAAYLARLSGWNLSATGLDPQALATLASGFVSALEELDNQPADNDLGIEILLSVLPRLAQAADALAAFGEGTTLPPAAPADLAGQFVEDLLSGVLVYTLGRFHPAVRSGLEALGILAYRPRPEIRLGTALVRPAQGGAHIDFALIGNLFSQPGPVLLERFGLAAGSTDNAATIAQRCFPLWAALLRDLRVRAWSGGMHLPTGLLSPAQTAALERTLLVRLPFDGSLGGGGSAGLSIALTLFDLPGGGVELVIAPQGSLSLSRRIGDWDLALGATGSVEAVSITRNAVGFASGNASLDLTGAFGRAPGAAPLLRIGARDGPHVELGTIALEGSLALSTSQPRPSGSFRLAIGGLTFKGAAAPGDGFLGKTLPADGFGTTCDLALEWDGLGPLRFSGAAGLDLALPLNLALGPIGLSRFRLAVQAGTAGLTAAASVNVSLKIGPILGLVEDIGLRAALRPGGQAGIPAPTIDFKPPAGLALKIESGPVKGGGYVSFEPEIGRYSGALQLSVKAVSLAAIGIVNTRLPEGRPGFSFLVLIAAEFPGLPLPFGFMLKGVGGLVGINRRMDVQALKLKVAEGVLGSILFPRDPVGRIEAVMADLRSVFPVKEGRHVFSPMVKLNWGPSGLLAIEVAIILDIPAPLRLAILGRMRLALPSVEKALVDIRLDVAGILDFDRQEAAIGASLVDSRLCGFVLTGDMAMFLGWGATKSFAMSMGGFFPGFPVPAGMPPAMRRLSLALSDSANPVLRFTSYFAVTSNTVQFGGSLEVRASSDTVIGNLAIEGKLAFDAFFQFDPFFMHCCLAAYLAILRNNTPLLSARLEADLTGPRPWHAVGYAEIQVVVTFRIGFEFTSGETDEIAPAVVDLGRMLRDEIAQPSSWSTALPSGSGALVTIRDGVSDEAGLVLHPLGEIRLLQRLLPFGKRITAYGGARPLNDAVRFELVGLALGARSGAAKALGADFAPGQFERLSEDEKLHRPAFEEMQAGGAAGFDSFAAPASGALLAGGYQNIVLGDESSTPLAANERAAVDLPRQTARDAGLAATRPGIAVLPERFVLADTGTMQRHAASSATSRSQVQDQLAAQRATGRATLGVLPARAAWG